MQTIIKLTDANVCIEQLGKQRHRVSVSLAHKKCVAPRYVCETSYPISLIKRILEIKGPVWLCDEIRRDEDDSYVRKYIAYSTLSYIEEDRFINKDILDFGCGSGGSTMNLARLFPQSNIVGIDFVAPFLEIAKLRAAHHNIRKVEFLLSANANAFPHGLGVFDYVFFSAVYEHLLPSERQTLLTRIWHHLKPEGILFLNETPHRYFPIESHTTGLPFINYAPDSLALHLARRFSKRITRDESWDNLLRMGIRGGTITEILRILRATGETPVLLKPVRQGLTDQSDIWYKVASQRTSHPVKKLAISMAYSAKKIVRINVAPYLSLAIRKSA